MKGFNITQNGKTGPAFFIFATEDGTISAWNPNVNPDSSVIAVDNSKGGSPTGDGAVYKGLAIGTTQDGTFLYAANFRNGSVDVFNSKFQLVKSFTDPTVPNGYAPFNVQVLDGKLFVTFAQQDATRHDDVAGAGHGFVDEFDLNGRKIDRVASHGPLNSPWGLASRRRASVSSPTTCSSAISATAPLTSSAGPISSSASWIGRTASRFTRPIFGGSWPTATTSCSPQASKQIHGLFGSLSATSSPATLTGNQSGFGSHSGAATGAGHFYW